MTVVCCDSHTTTTGAFGPLAFGIGTSQVEHVLATQTLPMTRPKTMRVTVNGRLAEGVSGKDLILALIVRIGTAGAQGHIIECDARRRLLAGLDDIDLTLQHADDIARYEARRRPALPLTPRRS